MNCLTEPASDVTIVVAAFAVFAVVFVGYGLVVAADAVGRWVKR